MKSEKISRLFYLLAQLARDARMEFSLSLEDSEAENKILNGAMGHSLSKSKGLTLRCWWPDPAAAEDDETEGGEEGDADGED